MGNSETLGRGAIQYMSAGAGATPVAAHFLHQYSELWLKDAPGWSMPVQVIIIGGAHAGAAHSEMNDGDETCRALSPLWAAGKANQRKAVKVRCNRTESGEARRLARWPRC